MLQHREGDSGMRRGRRILLGALTALLCIGLFLPLEVSAADLYFTAINDSVSPLTSDTMPFWSGGILYVPYTVFDASLNSIGVDLGMYASYSRNRNTVTLYNGPLDLEFDLNSGTCRDVATGDTYRARAIMRSGKPYLPLNTVCSFFHLTYTYSTLPYIPQGFLVRIKSADVVLSDSDFIDAASNTINRRLRDYTQSLSSAETTSPARPGTAVTEEPVPSSSVPTYLAVRCTGADGLTGILSALDNAGRCAVFFLSPQVIREEGDLVRRILGTGHSIGILAQGDSLAQTRQLLEEGNRALEQTACARTTLAYAPQDQRSALEEEGAVCWNETLLLSPGDSVGASSFAATTLRRLEGRRRSTYLTLEGGAAGARVLSTLLRQLDSEHFVVSIPMETRL